MKFSKSLWAAIFLAAVSLFTLNALAQSNSATLSGTLVDPSGAAVPNAKVSIVNTATNARRILTTNRDGYFVAADLNPGTYKIQAYREGFAPIEVPSITLHTADRRDIHLQLTIGTAKQSVTVTGNTVAVGTSPGLSTVVDQRLVANLPLNGRTIQPLLALTPGLRTVGTGDVGQLTADGLRTSQNYYTIDGVSANIGVEGGIPGPYAGAGGVPGMSVAGTSHNLVSMDDVREFKVQTSAFSAEYGREPGAQVQMTTLSGTNQFHGSLYEYLRNSALDDTDWFAKHNGLKKPPDRNNDFGGTFGGPIIRNKTFFFASYEGLRLVVPLSGVGATLCTEWRAQAAPSLQPYMAALPTPTGPCNFASGSAPVAYSFANRTRSDDGSLRVDQELNSKISMFARYNQSSGTGQQHLGATWMSLNQMNTRTLTAGATITPTPDMTNDFRYNWSTNEGVTALVNPTDVPGVTAPDAAHQIIAGISPASGQVYLGFPAGSSYYVGENGDNTTHQQNVTDTLTLARGKHLLKFGSDFRYLWPEIHITPYYLQAVFPTLASLTSGVAPSVQGRSFSPENFKYHQLALFAQDTWRITPRLTLDYGLRWEYNPPPSVDPGPMTLVGIDNPATATLSQPGAPLFHSPNTNFAPRVGIAYEVGNRSGWETVMRGGYGIFYDVSSGTNAFAGLYPYSNTVTQANVQFPFPDLTMPEAPTTPPFPATTYVGYNPDYVTPRVYQWNVTWGQGLGKGQKLTVSYVGNAGRRLMERINGYNTLINNPNFAPGTLFSYITNSPNMAGYSNYDALQVQFMRRTKRVQAIVNYTLSHAMDNASADWNSFGALTTNLQEYLSVKGFTNSSDYADSVLDRRHQFSAALSLDVPAISRAGGLLKKITGSWSLEAMIQAQSAAPLTLTYNDCNNPGGTCVSFRPDIVPGVPVWLNDSSAPMGKTLNPAAFAPVPQAQEYTRLGTYPRNSIRLWGFWQPDLAVRRQFGITERLKLQFKAEAYNIVNHPNFAPLFFTSLGSYRGGTFLPSSPTNFAATSMMNQPSGSGYTNADWVSPVYAEGGPRSIQLSLKLIF